MASDAISSVNNKSWLSQKNSQVSDNKGPAAHDIIDHEQKKDKQHLKKEEWSSPLDFFFSTLGYAGLF